MPFCSVAFNVSEACCSLWRGKEQEERLTLHPCFCPENGLDKSHHHSLWRLLLVCGWLRFTCQSQTMSHHHKGPMAVNVIEPSLLHGMGWRSGEGPWEREWCCHGTGWAFLSTAQTGMGLMSKFKSLSKAVVISSLPLQVDWLKKIKNFLKMWGPLHCYIL